MIIIEGSPIGEVKKQVTLTGVRKEGDTWRKIEITEMYVNEANIGGIVAWFKKQYNCRVIGVQKWVDVTAQYVG